MGRKGVGSMSNHQNCKLIYFRQYSDFCFQAEDGFTVRVSENQGGQTEIIAEHSGISRKIAVFQQCALEMFHEISPSDWICGSSGYLIQLYQQGQCVICQNMGNFLEKIRKKY